MALLLTFDICLLTHHSNRLVGSLDLDRFDFTDRHAIDHGCLGLFGLLSLNSHFFRPDRLCGKVSGSAGVSKAFIHTLRFAHSLMVAYDVLSCDLLSGLIWDSLQLLIFHLPGDSLTCIFGHGVVLVAEQLLLDRLHFIIDSVTVEKGRVSNSN